MNLFIFAGQLATAATALFAVLVVVLYNLPAKRWPGIVTAAAGIAMFAFAMFTLSPTLTPFGPVAVAAGVLVQLIEPRKDRKERPMP